MGGCSGPTCRLYSYHAASSLQVADQVVARAFIGGGCRRVEPYSAHTAAPTAAHSLGVGRATAPARALDRAVDCGVGPIGPERLAAEPYRQASCWLAHTELRQWTPGAAQCARLVYTARWPPARIDDRITSTIVQNRYVVTATEISDRRAWSLCLGRRSDGEAGERRCRRASGRWTTPWPGRSIEEPSCSLAASSTAPQWQICRAYAAADSDHSDTDVRQIDAPNGD